MRPGKRIQYYGEGVNEVKLLNVLKTDMQLIRPGKVDRFNVIDQLFTGMRLRLLKPETTVVLVFDTDTKSKGKLEDNLLILENHPSISGVILIPQVKNLQDELMRACSIKSIDELLGTKGTSSFKRKFNKVTNLADRLRNCGFNVDLLWNQTPAGVFLGVPNEAGILKKK